MTEKKPATNPSHQCFPSKPSTMQLFFFCDKVKLLKHKHNN